VRVHSPRSCIHTLSHNMQSTRRKAKFSRTNVFDAPNHDSFAAYLALLRTLRMPRTDRSGATLAGGTASLVEAEAEGGLPSV
jgi:hypothetical protein